MAEALAVIDRPLFAVSLHGFKPGHGQPLAGAPLSVGFLAIHEWPSETLPEVFCGILRSRSGPDSSAGLHPYS